MPTRRWLIINFCQGVSGVLPWEKTQEGETSNFSTKFVLEVDMATKTGQLVFKRTSLNRLRLSLGGDAFVEMTRCSCRVGDK